MTKEYFIHDNGGRPFIVYVNEKKKCIFIKKNNYDDEYDSGSDDPEDYNNNQDDSENYNNQDDSEDCNNNQDDSEDYDLDSIDFDFKSDDELDGELNFENSVYKYTNIFIGKDINDKTNLGNSILVELGPYHYMFIGWEIYEFFTEDPIVDYYSEVGNNDVPYPYAIGTKNIYLMIENIYFDKNLFKILEDNDPDIENLDIKSQHNNSEDKHSECSYDSNEKELDDQNSDNINYESDSCLDSEDSHCQNNVSFMDYYHFYYNYPEEDKINFKHINKLIIQERIW